MSSTLQNESDSLLNELQKNISKRSSSPFSKSQLSNGTKSLEGIMKKSHSSAHSSGLKLEELSTSKKSLTWSDPLEVQHQNVLFREKCLQIKRRINDMLDLLQEVG